jgi:hypothetical protein
MRYHAERIRRIQLLCAQLDDLIQNSHQIQHTVEQLNLESAQLLNDLRETRTSTPKSPARTGRGEAVRKRAPKI